MVKLAVHGPVAESACHAWLVQAEPPRQAQAEPRPLLLLRFHDELPHLATCRGTCEPGSGLETAWLALAVVRHLLLPDAYPPWYTRAEKLTCAIIPGFDEPNNRAALP